MRQPLTATQLNPLPFLSSSRQEPLKNPMMTALWTVFCSRPEISHATGNSQKSVCHVPPSDTPCRPGQGFSYFGRKHIDSIPQLLFEQPPALTAAGAARTLPATAVRTSPQQSVRSTPPTYIAVMLPPPDKGCTTNLIVSATSSPRRAILFQRVPSSQAPRGRPTCNTPKWGRGKALGSRR